MTARVFLNLDALRARGIPYSTVHLRRLEARGLFPRRIHLGTGNAVAWDEGEITAWQNERLADRDRRRGSAGVAIAQ
jgi:predicted DNA-binding transcriptional regulator AlpA